MKDCFARSVMRRDYFTYAEKNDYLRATIHRDSFTRIGRYPCLNNSVCISVYEDLKFHS